MAEMWLSYATLHRLWREAATYTGGSRRAGDDHYLSFGRSVGELAIAQRDEDLRRSLLARAEELAGAFTQVAVERLIDEAFSHDEVVRARRDEVERV